MGDKEELVESAPEEDVLKCCKEFRCALSETTKGVVVQIPINGTGGNPSQIIEDSYFPCSKRKTHAEVLEALRIKKSSPPPSSPEV